MRGDDIRERSAAEKDVAGDGMHRRNGQSGERDLCQRRVRSGAHQSAHPTPREESCLETGAIVLPEDFRIAAIEIRCNDIGRKPR